MSVPDFLTHYYESADGPFSNLSMLPLAQAEQILEEIRRNGNRFASQRSPEEVRKMLSRYRSGLNKGRGSADGSDTEAPES